MANDNKTVIEKVNENKYVKQTKSSMVSLFFSRAGVFVLLVLLQMGLVYYIYKYLKVDASLLLGGEAVFSLILMIIILNMDSILPAYKLSWFILIALAPAVGIIAFLINHFDIGHKREQERVIRIEDYSRKYQKKDEDLMAELKVHDKGAYNRASYFYDLGGFPVHKNTSTKYYPVGEDIFADIIKAIQGAKDFIFIEIFIIDYGYMWGTVLEELVKKVNEGVEVRLLIDGTNLLTRVKTNFPKQMESMGIKCKVFSKMVPVMSTYYNNRDHRKIFVIDNEIAFTGGINLADEYINVYERFGHWKDCGLRLKGEATENFTMIFLQMWNANGDNIEDFSSYLGKKSDPTGLGYVMPFADNPMDEEYFATNSIMGLLNNATDYVYIMTPYLIIEDQILHAFQNAAKRGVDVRICLPHIPDKKIAFALAKTNYKALLDCGVKIIEYTPGFCHSKTWLSDDTYGFVGTINLDYRALYLNYECGVWMKDTAALVEMKSDFEVFFNIGTHITMEDVENRSFIEKAVGFIAQPFAPLF